MGKLFVSYRRNGAHTLAVAGLAERLAKHFGPDCVFIDTGLPPGQRYPDELRAELAASDVVVAVIHDGWVADFAVARHLDWVRYELSTALRTGKTVIPVLLEAARQPEYDQIPADVADVTQLQSTPLRSAHYQADLVALIATIERTAAAPEAALAIADPAGDLPARPRLRLTLRAASLGAVFSGLPLLSAYNAGYPAWQMFLTAALLTAVLLAALNVLLLVLAAMRPRLDESTRRGQQRSFSENLKNTWPFIAVCLLITGLAWVDSPLFDLPNTSVKLLITGCVAAAVARWLQHHVQQIRALDTTWPPMVTPDTLTFRRAATRLHEMLTSGPSPSREFARQQQAESVYRALATVRIALEERALAGWRQWLAKGYYHKDPLPPAILGMLGGVIGLAVAGLGLRIALVGASLRPVVLALATAGIACLLAVTALALHLRTERRSTRRLVAELRNWDAVLRPLVFPQRAMSEPQQGISSSG